MIAVRNEDMYRKNTSIETQNGRSYRNRIIYLKNLANDETRTPKINPDGSLNFGFCDSYALSINDKFKCPLDTRFRISRSEEQNLKAIIDNKYECEHFCVKSLKNFFEKDSNNQVISEYGKGLIKQKIKDYIMKA